MGGGDHGVVVRQMPRWRRNDVPIRIWRRQRWRRRDVPNGLRHRQRRHRRFGGRIGAKGLRRSADRGQRRGQRRSQWNHGPVIFWGQVIWWRNVRGEKKPYQLNEFTQTTNTIYYLSIIIYYHLSWGGVLFQIRALPLISALLFYLWLPITKKRKKSIKSFRELMQNSNKTWQTFMGCFLGRIRYPTIHRFHNALCWVIWWNSVCFLFFSLPRLQEQIMVNDRFF